MAENTNPHSGNNQGGQQKPTLSWSQPASAKPATPSAAPTSTPVPPVKQTATTSTNSANTSNTTSSSTGTYVGIFVAGLIVGALIGWGITSSNNNGSTSTTATSTSMTASSTMEGSTTQGDTNTSIDLTGSAMDTTGAVTLATTQPAGFAVAVTKILVTQPTWLVVYEDHSGVPGNVIGAGLFFQGSTSGTIQLLRATLPGQSYFVGQTLDDGDKMFSLATDKPVRDAQGNPLFTEFTAQ